MSKRILAGAAVAASVAAVAAVPSLTGAQSGARDITVFETVRAAKFVDVKPTTKGDQFGAGDQVALRVALSDASGAAIGTGFSSCVGVPTRDHQIACTVTYRLSDGDIVFSGVFHPAPGDRGAVVGGSGAYASARGEAEVVAPREGTTGGVVVHLAG